MPTGFAPDTGLVQCGAHCRPHEIPVATQRAAQRSPLLLRCMDDYLAGQRYPLALIHTDLAVLGR